VSRPPLPIGTWGEIHTQQVRRGTYRARARFRDRDGRTRAMTATGRTRAAAEGALRQAMTKRQTPTADATQIHQDMRLSALAEIWLARRENEGRIELSTLNEYRRTLHRTVLPAIGGLLLRELTVGRLDQFLTDLWKTSPNKQRKAKVVVGAILDLAARQDAIPYNPVRGTSRLQGPRAQPRAMTPADVQQTRRAVQAWVNRRRSGPKGNRDMMDIVDLMIATGARIGKILALRWSDIDLDHDPALLTIAGTIKNDPGRGTYRKTTPKTDHGLRTVVLPPFAVAALKERRAATPPNPLDAVFATRNGTWHQLSNIERRWRQIREGTGLDWVTPHTFRRTVATVIAQRLGADAAAGQLGHSSATITRQFYIAKPDIAADATDALGALAPAATAGDETKTANVSGQ
jgi:integrase